MYKKKLALNNLEGLICHKIQASNPPNASFCEDPALYTWIDQKVSGLAHNF